MSCRFYESTVGKKIIMAVTGIILVLFVIGHMAGNLKAFLGTDSAGIERLDHYAVFLREIGSSMLGYGNFLWVVRGVLLVSLLLHTKMAVQLTARNQESRAQRYAMQRFSSASFSSITMAIGGSILLVFIIFHILHFTTGQLNYTGFVPGHVYANVYNAFQSLAMVSFYVIAMIALCFHLYHGTWSVFQTLGIEAKGWNCCLGGLSKIVSIVVFIGFIAVPVACYLHLLPPPSNHFMTVNE